ncbi:MAG: hypothetical protein B7C24_07360 [Bacteroidetes bacterium 4572_77]|nr:MAG: hypothetical protein B7C24_07360 [Bacteroidetes bacterium 4572_77]
MKKITFLAVLFLSVTMMASAQNSTRTTAYNYLRKGKLDLAKENIDKAVQHEKTMNDPKSWFYYGSTYLQLATTEDEAYKDLDPDALVKAYEGYKKCMELDEKKRYFTQSLQDMLVISNNFYSRGLNYYNAQEYPKAYGSFSEAVKVNQTLDNVDTLAIYACAMTANSAEDMQQEAKDGYTQLIEMGYNNASIYSDLANIYKNEGDLAKAKEILQLGFGRYPSEAAILFAQINILLEEDKHEEVIASLEKAIQLAPENYTLYFVLGQSYEKMNDFDQAEIAYKKAIEMKPDYSDALFNLGAIHYNKAVEVYAQANDLPLDAADEYETLTATAKIDFLNAQPYFEQAFELMPDDQNLINSLKMIYQKTNQLEKLTALKNGE